MQKALPVSRARLFLCSLCELCGYDSNIGGREGIRTLDPRIANAVLSQLSYSPTPRTDDCIEQAII